MLGSIMTMSMLIDQQVADRLVLLHMASSYGGVAPLSHRPVQREELMPSLEWEHSQRGGSLMTPTVHLDPVMLAKHQDGVIR